MAGVGVFQDPRQSSSGCTYEEDRSGGVDFLPAWLSCWHEGPLFRGKHWPHQEKKKVRSL